MSWTGTLPWRERIAWLTKEEKAEFIRQLYAGAVAMGPSEHVVYALEAMVSYDTTELSLWALADEYRQALGMQSRREERRWRLLADASW